MSMSQRGRQRCVVRYGPSYESSAERGQPFFSKKPWARLERQRRLAGARWSTGPTRPSRAPRVPVSREPIFPQCSTMRADPAGAMSRGRQSNAKKAVTAQ
eukprot:6037331-Prymnesium_polylepis.1